MAGRYVLSVIGQLTHMEGEQNNGTCACFALRLAKESLEG